MVEEGSARRWPLALLALATLAAALAGCTGSEPEPAPVEEAGPEEQEGPAAGLVSTREAANATQPEDQSEFAKSLDEKFHTHNYWGGALEKVLMDDEVASGPMAPSVFEDVFAYFVEVQLSEGFGHTRVLLPEGSIVPPETERLEVSVTWASNPRITGLRLGYATASDPNGVYTDLGPLPDGGGTVEILPALEQNDIPHTVESKWRLFLVPHNNANPAAPGLFNGSVHVTVTAYRSDVLFVAPPHPDYWGDNTTRHLFSMQGSVKGERLLFPVMLPGAQNGWEFAVPPDGALVPPHTGVLTLDLTWTNSAGTADPFGTSLELYYNPPNSVDFLRAEALQRDDGHAVYAVPVDARMWDSPYAPQSAWTFLLAVDTDAPMDQGTFFGDVGLFDGTYELHVTGEREVVL